MIGARIKLAREVCRITQEELAAEIGTTQSGIASIESGLYRPSEGYLKKIATATEFDVSFFEKGDLPELPFGTLLYRAQMSVKKSMKTEAHALAQVAFELALFLAGRLKRIPINIPKLDEDPVKCAQLTRDALGLAPNNPIRDFVTLLEKNGVFVLSLPVEMHGLDGFSAWAGTDPPRPVIALLRGKTPFRERFTGGEELAHLVMHSPLRTSIAEADREARIFAQEFLLPAEAMIAAMEPPITLTSLSALKPRWGVSNAFLAKRAESLSLITTNQYRYLAQQMRSTWGAISEPGDENVKPERPRLLRKMAEMLYGTPINIMRLYRESGIPAQLLGEILAADETSGKKAKLLAFKN
jgi:Zn-dependent peptidase ImmA (M78 family)/DNA-binding XRE family transcriptional regulator